MLDILLRGSAAASVISMLCKGARPEEVKHEEDKKHEFGWLYDAMNKKYIELCI